jgi:soluble lytic murein transglycosylase-like protein
VNKELLTWLGFGIAGTVLVKMFSSMQNADGSTPVTSFTNDPVSAMTDAIKALAGWKNVNKAADWLPTLAAAEISTGLPTDLLARVAYEESRFREEIIRGTKPSPAGALGIMQMMPQYFQSVRAQQPYSDDAVTSQINEAANLLASLYTRFNSWPLAIAAYNAGAGNVSKYGGIPPFAETQNYVAAITADVPGLV